MSVQEDLFEIVRLLSERRLNTDVALFHLDGHWWAEALNPNGMVMLGEVSGIYRSRPWSPNLLSTDVTDPAEAVHELLEVVRNVA